MSDVKLTEGFLQIYLVYRGSLKTLGSGVLGDPQESLGTFRDTLRDTQVLGDTQ